MDIRFLRFFTFISLFCFGIVMQASLCLPAYISPVKFDRTFALDSGYDSPDSNFNSPKHWGDKSPEEFRNNVRMANAKLWTYDHQQRQLDKSATISSKSTDSSSISETDRARLNYIVAHQAGKVHVSSKRSSHFSWWCGGCYDPSSQVIETSRKKF